MRLESTNNTALLALGARKPPSGTCASLFSTPGLERSIEMTAGMGMAGTAAAARTAQDATKQQPPRTFFVRIKHVNVKDIIQFMEGEKRYAKSKLLYNAYLNYKW